MTEIKFIIKTSYPDRLPHFHWEGKDVVTVMKTDERHLQINIHSVNKLPLNEFMEELNNLIIKYTNLKTKIK